jgi:hypothetical protein
MQTFGATTRAFGVLNFRLQMAEAQKKGEKEFD